MAASDGTVAGRAGARSPGRSRGRPGCTRCGNRDAAAVVLLAILQAPAAPKQAVVETSAGTFVIDLAPEQAPNHDGVFHEDRRARAATTGTIFHKMIKYGIVQGGDPLSKDPAKRAQYGTGGLNAVKAEARAPKMTRGSVAAVHDSRQGRQRRRAVLHRRSPISRRSTASTPSSGTCRTASRSLQKISETPVDDEGRRDRARRDHARDDPRHAARAVRQRHRAGSRAPIAPCSTRAPVRSRSSSFRTRRRSTSASSCGWRRPACTTAWRFIASRRASSFRPAR